MSCKFGNTGEYTFVQCSTDPLGGPSLDLLDEQQEKNNLKPYADGECRHDGRFERHGVLTCQDCGAIYNERTLEWVTDNHFDG